MSALTGDMDLRPKDCLVCQESSEAAQWRDCWLHGERHVCPDCGNCAGPVPHGPAFATA